MNKQKCETFEELLQALTNHQPGEIITITSPNHLRPDPLDYLTITNPVHLQGGIIDVHTIVKIDEGKSGRLLLDKVYFRQGLTISFPNGDIVLRDLKVLGGYRNDCLEIGKCNSVLVNRCEILRGSDSLFLNCDNAHVKDCLIEEARNRGIFGNSCFKIEGTIIRGCGAYGIKSRVGWRDLGRNNLQPSPW